MDAARNLAPTKSHYIVGNWKMNGSRAALAQIDEISAAAARKAGPSVALALPATLIDAAAARTSQVAIGAQDVHADACGAFTGSLSAAMLKEAGATFTIVGHSEARARLRDTDEDVRRKAEAAHKAGLDVILCVGEDASARAEGCARRAVVEQLQHCLPDDADASWLTIAYEPIWAIGSGRTPTPIEVAEIHTGLREICQARLGEAGAAIRLLYGGSVVAGNTADLLAAANVDGLLIGGASLNAETFLPILSLTAG